MLHGSVQSGSGVRGKRQLKKRGQHSGRAWNDVGLVERVHRWSDERKRVGSNYPIELALIDIVGDIVQSRIAAPDLRLTDRAL